MPSKIFKTNKIEILFLIFLDRNSDKYKIYYIILRNTYQN